MNFFTFFQVWVIHFFILFFFFLTDVETMSHHSTAGFYIWRWRLTVRLELSLHKFRPFYWKSKSTFNRERSSNLRKISLTIFSDKTATMSDDGFTEAPNSLLINVPNASMLLLVKEISLNDFPSQNSPILYNIISWQSLFQLNASTNQFHQWLTFSFNHIINPWLIFKLIKNTDK